MLRRAYRPEDYTVGWISALPIELNAALQMLDEEHHNLPSSSNSVSYVLGRIAAYCVVIAWLPAGEYGTSSAAGVASDMTLQFPSLRFCLMVGIGGGVPSDDVRLGDVVVSQPNGTNGGVIQYDLGKSTTSGFERKGFLNAPPRFLRSLLSLYQARNFSSWNRLSPTSHVFCPKVTKEILNSRPEKDLLFPADYEHQGGESCESCEKSLAKARTPRATAIHYGTIASGNQVIKTGKIRDSLSKDLGEVLCFEMEAAGIMNELPCLVIRGICDYADSHKNKEWQPYAAATAAAYAKELLCEGGGHPKQASRSKATSLVLRKSKTRLVDFYDKSSFDHHLAEFCEEDEEPDLVLIQSISSYKAADILTQYSSLRCPGTAQWILKHENFNRWLKGGSQVCLWLDGKIGAGKTLLTSSIIDSLVKRTSNHDIAVIHYFFRRSDKSGLTATELARSIVQQLLSHMNRRNLSCPSEIMDHVRQVFNRRTHRPDLRNIYEKILIPLVLKNGGVILATDGVDECEDDEVDMIFELIEKLLDTKSAKILISGRESLGVSNRIPNSTNIHISEKDSFPDIKRYIKWKIEKMMRRRSITDNQRILQSIHTSLERKADRMILWVKLQIESLWRDCFNDEEITEALNHLPKDLNETYQHCLDRIESNHNPYARDHAMRIISWTLTAKKPLSLLEVREALAINTETGKLNRQQMPTISDTLSSCANLIILDDDTLLEGDDGLDAYYCKDKDSRGIDNARILVVHHSCRQYLESSSNHHTFLHAIRLFLKEPRTSLTSLCLKHLLSEDYALTVEQVAPKCNITLQPPRPEMFMGWLGSFVMPFTAKTKPITLAIQIPRSSRTSSVALPAIFHYARDQWPALTRKIGRDHKCFSDFEVLAMQPNLTYRFHPWAPLGQSAESHRTALLAWAIFNHHYALQQLAFKSNLDADILRIPIPQYGDYNSVFLAIQCSNVRAIREMHHRYPDVVRGILQTKDQVGVSALHLAVKTGASEVVALLLSEIRISYPPFSTTTQTPLEIAVMRQHISIVRSLVEALWASYESSGGIWKTHELRSARDLAIEHGLGSVLEAIDSATRSPSLDSGTFGSIFGSTADSFELAFKSGRRTDILIHLLNSGSSIDDKWLHLCAKHACQRNIPSLLAQVLVAAHVQDIPLSALEAASRLGLFEAWFEWLKINGHQVRHQHYHYSNFTMIRRIRVNVMEIQRSSFDCIRPRNGSQEVMTQLTSERNVSDIQSRGIRPLCVMNP